MSSLDQISSSIDAAVSNFAKNTPALERRLMELLDATIKELEVRNGSILSNVNNLKKINDIKRKFGKIILNNDYLKQVKSFTNAFQRVSDLQIGYLSQFNEKFTPLKTASVIQDMAIDNTIDSLTESGLNEAVSKPIMDMLKSSVVSGGSYSELAESLRKSILSSEGKPSILDKHIATVTKDALNRFSGQSLKLQTDDLGVEWYRYSGSNKTTSREFCKYLLDKEWIHISEFDDVIKGHIDGHVCELNPKTKLPKGMIEGTNSANLIVNRGGYNCEHRLFPVPSEIVPDEVKRKLSIRQLRPASHSRLWRSKT